MIQDTLDAGTMLWSELEFASRQATAPLLAVTGTNGKTSTVEAAQAMLEASGAKVCAAGNIGTALSDVATEAWDVIVVEASSFQLRFIDRFHPTGAALLNVTPDHLDWHGSFDAYVDAKANITRNQSTPDVFVYGADDAVAQKVSATTSARTVAVSGSSIPDGGVGIAEGSLRLGDARFEAPDLGPDFLTDLAAAAVLARHEGATVDGISAALAAFRPGPHRRRTVGVWDGIRWVDDSKATNPEATAAAADVRLRRLDRRRP